VKMAGDLTAAAPRLLAAANDEERDRASQALAAARDGLNRTIEQLGEQDAAAMSRIVQPIVENLAKLRQSVADQQSIVVARGAMIADLRKTHQKLAEKLIPIADDVAFTLAMGLETVADKQDLAAVRTTLL